MPLYPASFVKDFFQDNFQKQQKSAQQGLYLPYWVLCLSYLRYSSVISQNLCSIAVTLALVVSP